MEMTDDKFVEIIQSASLTATEHETKLKSGVLFDINESFQNVAVLTNNLGLLRNGINKLSNEVSDIDLTKGNIDNLPIYLHSMVKMAETTSMLWTVTFISLVEEYGCIVPLSSLVSNGGTMTEGELVEMINKAKMFKVALEEAIKFAVGDTEDGE